MEKSLVEEFKEFIPLSKLITSSYFDNVNNSLRNLVKNSSSRTSFEKYLKLYAESLIELLNSDVYNEDSEYVIGYVTANVDIVNAYKDYYTKLYNNQDPVAASLAYSSVTMKIENLANYMGEVNDFIDTVDNLIQQRKNLIKQLDKEPKSEIPTEKPTQMPTQRPSEVSTQAPTQKPSEVPTQAPTQMPTQKATQISTEKSTQKLTPTQTPTQPATVNNNSSNTNNTTNTNGNNNSNSANTVSGKVVNTDDNSGIFALGTLLVSASGIVFVSRKRKHS